MQTSCLYSRMAGHLSRRETIVPHKDLEEANEQHANQQHAAYQYFFSVVETLVVQKLVQDGILPIYHKVD